ncbi:MAG: YebC/PmpR family DNA-binding transcriptional regulator [Firmicutes bacterium]|nr:YebC/PmpR family DNA-binding transcriptional regulator [Bacillota bacterium]
MAGHSKWANIKRRKARVDAQRGKIFTKLSRELMVSAREGGGDVESNLRLRLAVQKARENNLPNDSIQRAILKGTGELEGEALEGVSYEGYGPGGVALLMETLTDNRNRTVAEIRHLMTRSGGNLGETGCVAWMFERKGFIIIEKSGLEEDDVIMAALEAGAEDVELDGDSYEVITAPETMEHVKEYLQQAGMDLSSAEVTMLPKSTVNVTEPEVVKKLLELLENLEELDDVQNVYANFDIPEELMA